MRFQIAILQNKLESDKQNGPTDKPAGYRYGVVTSYIIS